MLIRFILVLVIISAVTLAIMACAMPGTTLGVYTVVGTPVTNTCGSGLDAPDPWDFDVELSLDGTTLYWNWLDGSSLLSGTLSSDAATMTLSQSANVDETADGGDGPCNMERDDDLQVTVASGAVPSTFAATITYTFSVVSGSTCTDQLSSAGGAYDTLPCTISYALSGSYSSAQ
jgi:hypothetical protein